MTETAEIKQVPKWKIVVASLVLSIVAIACAHLGLSAVQTEAAIEGVAPVVSKAIGE